MQYKQVKVKAILKMQKLMRVNTMNNRYPHYKLLAYYYDNALCTPTMLSHDVGIVGDLLTHSASVRCRFCNPENVFSSLPVKRCALQA